MHTNLEKQIDQFLSQVMQFAENKHEILLGKCQSDIKLTSTQEHLLMLLNGEPTTNARMAETLSVSPAAITKALKKLQDLELISPTKSKTDERFVGHKNLLRKYSAVNGVFDENLYQEQRLLSAHCIVIFDVKQENEKSPQP